MDKHEKRKVFMAQYEANFGTFPARKGRSGVELDHACASAWFEFIDKVEEGLLRRLVEKVAADHEKSRGRPYLAAFKSAHRIIWNEIHAGRCESSGPRHKCGICYGTGSMIYLAAVYTEEDGRKYIRLGDTDRPLYEFYAPCMCDEGEKLYRKKPEKWSHVNRAKIREWIAKARGDARFNNMTREGWYVELQVRSRQENKDEKERLSA